MNRLSFNDAKKVSIADYLSALGFNPAKVRGVDQWYHSPFRDERTPSFKVNTNLNLWFDHGTGEGGTILDLGARLHQCTLSEFMDKLSGGNYSKTGVQRQPLSIKAPEIKLEVLSVNLLADQNLLYYLSMRGISEITATAFCKEVDFQIKQRQYKAIGFPNRSGAYELRNSWFKGSSSPKDISFINNHSHKLSVLEGFMDLLSVHQLAEMKTEGFDTNNNFLVLNSLQLLNRCLPILQSHKEVNLFLDNDSPAQNSKKLLTQKGIDFYDSSHFYHGQKDVNDYLKEVVNKTRVRQRRLRRRSI